MTVETQVVWAVGTPDQQEIVTIQEELAILTQQGATDGTYVSMPVQLGTMFIRHWTTMNDANNWINYVNGFGPVSAEIIQ